MEICNYKWKGKHDFFEKIIKNYSNNRWVDIEYEYYVALIDTFKGSERNNVLRSDFYINLVKPLNSCFNSILIKLLEYLHTIEITPEKSNRHIEGILMENTGARRNYSGEKLFVNFNYTTTMELYSDHFLPNNLIYIHGRLNNQSSPIIFGYGDEMDPHYEKLENLNSNDFLQNIKSFNYLKTGNYQKVIRFLENEFTVKVLGHSCGLSDRILLNTIFEHPKCRAIKIFYYQKSEKENDFFEKTQEISRHFRASMKGEMRKRIVSFDQCEPLLPLSKQN
ncbi:MAG: AbiH family protein [Draconibacterium sp.]